MAKKAYVYSGTDWVPLASEVTDLTAYSTSTEIANTYATKADNGLVHIETQTFSAVSGVSFSNDVFSSTYDNYKIMWNMSTATSGGNLTFRMRAAGSDNSSALYNWSAIGRESGTTLAESDIAQTSGKIGEYSTDVASYSIEIFSPFLAQYTEIATLGGRYSRRFYPFYCSHGMASSFDSISFLFSSGNLTGTASLYGYKK